ncbi:MAG: sensor histidine kinase [Oscillospiraceae bacterium]
MNEAVRAVVSLLNDAAVSVFGVLLSASFCSTLNNRRNRLIVLCTTILMLLPQGLVYLKWGMELSLKLYPLIVHLPIVILLFALTKKLLWSAISVLCAYLFCEIRRWIALLAVTLFQGSEFMQEAVELIITVPLLLVLLCFVSPAIVQIREYPIKTQLQFGLIPALYYAFDYLTRVYTNLLSSGSSVVLEFMPFICCVAYMLFLLYNSAEERKKQQLRQIQNNTDFQLSQAVREIAQLRESQAQAVRYRHDLRHHMQYLSTCLENGQQERAQSYISDVCGEIEASKVCRYCENETANLILSAFAERAKKAGIDMEIQGDIPIDIAVSDNNLCVLLSNSLENAIHACEPLAQNGERCVISIKFRFMEETGNFFLQITNPCRETVKFENGIPTSPNPDHGIGVQSICAIVERYGGCYNFSLKDGLFTLQLSL